MLKYIDEEKILLVICFEKDVDGFYLMNLGRFFVGKLDKIFCILYGIMKMFEVYFIDLMGKWVVVIGWSNIVGKLMV